MRLFLLIILCLLSIITPAQNIFKGFKPQLKAREGDTTNALLIENTGGGYCGIYVIRGTDTLRYHYDKNGKAVLAILDTLNLAGFKLFYLALAPDTLFINEDTLAIGVGANYWTLVGNYLYPYNLTDSVGIARANARTTLDVNGNTYIDSTLRVANINLTSASAGTSQVALVIDGGQNVDLNDLGDDFAPIEDSSLWIRYLGKLSPRTITDSLKIVPGLKEGSYFIVWNTADSTLYAMDTTGWHNQGGGGGVSYWTLVGNHLYPNNITDSVAVGGTVAKSIFTVRGTITLDNDSTAIIETESSGAGNPGDPLYLIGGGTDPYGAVYLNVSTGGTSLGEVGIGEVNTDDVSDSLLVMGRDNIIGQTSKALLQYWTFVDGGINPDTLYNNRAGLLFFKTDVVTDRWLKNARNTVLGVYAAWHGFINSDRMVHQGMGNTAIGYQALYSTTTGYMNTAIGEKSMYSNTTSSWNTAIGEMSMLSNTEGYQNVAVGESSLRGNTTGDKNTAIGRGGQYSNTLGNSNTAVGANALYDNTEGNYNTAIGVDALGNCVTGSSNVAIGYQAGAQETGSNKLYIDNSNTSTPLIGGDFSTNRVTINTFLNLAPSASAHASPVEGDVYYDSRTDRIKVYTTAGWKAIKWTDD